MRFLVVGSTYSAVLACEVLGDISGVEKVWNLPSGGPGYAVLSDASSKLSAWRELPYRDVGRVVLRDRWGKHLMGHRLEGYRTVKLPAKGLPRTGPLEALDPALQLVRCRKVEGGVSCQLSDGSELLCTGVVFGDGAWSRGRELMERLVRPGVDPKGVACWSFVRPDLLDLKAWEFRTALGKSVEQLPLPEGKVRVKLRFKTRVGSRQSIAELKALFSEFGSDMEALLEGVDEQTISRWQEEDPKVAFSPLPGALALGDAALGAPLLESFDWAARVSRNQMERMVESLLAENWNPGAFEPACQEALRPMLASERYLRAALHYDNSLLRPFRDLALRLIPGGLLADRVKERLGL